MDTRFAGSHRLGERRRRRLAVESDDAPSESPAPVELPATEGMTRVAHAPPHEPHREVVALPLGGLVPAQWWAYLLGGAVGLLIGAGIIAAGWSQSIGSTTAGGLPRLFSLPDAPVAAWYSGLLLSLSSQLSLLIWWGRSRSLKDFDGRYRVWKRAAGVWLFFSFCIVTGAHQALADTLLQRLPLECWRIDVVVWLVPAAGAGLVLLLALNREMADCRASRVALFFSANCYVVAGALRLKIEIPLTVPLQNLLLAGSALLGHLSLFFSMWLHARHVLHCTHDPSRVSRRRLSIPRPHFRIPKLAGWSKSTTAALGDEPSGSDSLALPACRSRKPVDLQPPVEAASPKESSPVANEAARPQRRIDAPPRRPAAGPRENVAPPIVARHVERIPAALPPPKSLARPSWDDDERPTHNGLADRAAQTSSALDATSADEEAAAADSEEDGWTESFPKPDMRGMSKKQRRRLMAELHEKARAAHRDE